jgi:Putative MetA-pathway of phenol degradation
MYGFRSVVSPALAVSILAAPIRQAAADEGHPDPRCDGVHSLASPLPEACLGVIDTDRPHQTDTPHVVPAGHVQFESAVAAVQLDRGRLLLFEDNYKFGLVSRIDLQVAFKHSEYSTTERRLLPPGPFQVRAKFNVVDEKGYVPAVTLVPWIFLPLNGSQPLRGGVLAFWGWELPAHLELEVNAGILLGTKPKPPAAIVLASALTYTVVGTFRVFADVYATGWDIALGTGALWAFTRAMQVDLGTYVGLSGDEPAVTPFVGFSVRR